MMLGSLELENVGSILFSELCARMIRIMLYTVLSFKITTMIYIFQ